MIARRSTSRTKNRDGFTLIEVLVTLVLIALLVGVVLPSVIRQLDRGEPVRITEDLEAVRSAARLFRVDVRRWPGTLEQLVEAPAGTGGWHETDDEDQANRDINDTKIPEGLRNRWNGPYLEIGQLTAGGTLLIGVGGEVQAAFASVQWGSSNFITAYVDHLTVEQARSISEIIDGHTEISTTDAGGRVRFDVGADELWYLMSPID